MIEYVQLPILTRLLLPGGLGWDCEYLESIVVQRIIVREVRMKKRLLSQLEFLVGILLFVPNWMGNLKAIFIMYRGIKRKYK